MQLGGCPLQLLCRSRRQPRRGDQLSAPTWPMLLNRLVAGQDLTAADPARAMRQVTADDFEPVVPAGFLVALRAKGETTQEMAGLIEEILSAAVPLPLGCDDVNVVGTGGDQAQTVSISTMAAIVVAAAGIPVVKHGGRSISSSSGSADVLEALGVSLALSPAAAAHCLTEAGICLLFAPKVHAGCRTPVPSAGSWASPRDQLHRAAGQIRLAAFRRKGDPELARVQVQPFLKAAENAFPSWVRAQTYRPTRKLSAEISGRKTIFISVR